VTVTRNDKPSSINVNKWLENNGEKSFDFSQINTPPQTRTSSSKSRQKSASIRLKSASTRGRTNSARTAKTEDSKEGNAPAAAVSSESESVAKKSETKSVAMPVEKPASKPSTKPVVAPKQQVKQAPIQTENEPLIASKRVAKPPSIESCKLLIAFSF
jgi:hypothetical protein